MQIENYIKESMKTEMAQLQQSAVHNHTAAMLEMGTNLLSQTAEQTRKLTDVETQVIDTYGKAPEHTCSHLSFFYAYWREDPSTASLTQTFDTQTSP